MPKLVIDGKRYTLPYTKKGEDAAAKARKLMQQDKAGAARAMAAANASRAMKGPVGYKAPAKNLFSPTGPKNRPTDRPSYGQPAASAAPKNRPTERPAYGKTDNSQSATPPARTATRGYVVKKGDTMWDIASRYKPSSMSTNTFLDKMIAANKMTRKSAGKIDIGQKIVIPRN